VNDKDGNMTPSSLQATAGHDGAGDSDGDICRPRTKIPGDSSARAVAVPLFHRRALEIHRLTADRAQDDPSIWRIKVTVEADADLALRIEANLYKLEDVLLVERCGFGHEQVGELS
jgi:hypothetical protein